jgi:predicted dehydrogenase
LHAQAIARSAHATLHGVCDPTQRRREATGRRFNVKPYASAGELFENEKLDAVTIATPDHLHVEVALAAIAAGCHVFCEKPLATTLAEAERMVDAAAERGLQLGVDYNRRFAFGYRTAKQWLASGSIGKLNYCLLRVSNRTPPVEVARTAEVMFTTLLTHHLDLMRYYGGEIRSLHARAGDEAPGELLKSVCLSLQFAGGAIGTIVGAYRDNQTRTAEWMELGGTTGAIVVEDITRRVTLFGTDPDHGLSSQPNHFVASDAFYDSLVEHVQAFIERVASGQPAPVNGRDGLLGLRLAAAAVESLATGQTIEVSGE